MSVLYLHRYRFDSRRQNGMEDSSSDDVNNNVNDNCLIASGNMSFHWHVGMTWCFRYVIRFLLTTYNEDNSRQLSHSGVDLFRQRDATVRMFEIQLALSTRKKYITVLSAGSDNRL